MGNEVSEPLKLEKRGVKLYQKQVLKLKILKGTGSQNPEPCTKGDGFLSIEETTNDVTHIAYRSLTGVNLFSGILHKTSGEVRKEDKEKRHSSTN